MTAAPIGLRCVPPISHGPPLRPENAMRFGLVVWLWLLYAVFARFARMSRGPRDRHRSRTCRRSRLGPPPGTAGPACARRLRDPARGLGAGYSQAAQSRLRRSRAGSGSPTRSSILTRRRARNRPRDTVKILSDFQADGRAGKIKTFADGLNIPIGLLPLPSAARRSCTTSPTST